MSADLHSLATVTLLRRDELDATVAVLVVVPGDERCHPLTGLIFGGEGFAGVVRPVFHRAEQRFGVGVVVGDPWPGERPEHAQLFQPAFQRGCAHGVAVIGVQDQRLLSALADPLSQASPADQIRCNGWILSLIHIPGHDLAAPDVDHQVEVKPDPAHGGGQIGVGVGPGRPTSLSAGGFPRPALRTGRATLTASGSPQAHASASVAHGVGMRLPR